MAFSTSDKTERTLAEINVIPLVDVMLVLLVIFMITAPMVMRGVDVAVPKTKSGNTIPEERLIITITKENELFSQGNKDDRVGLDELPGLINQWYAKRPVALDERTIYVRADAGVSYGTLMTVIDQAKVAGINAVGLVTDPRGTDDTEEEKATAENG